MAPKDAANRNAPELQTSLKREGLTSGTDRFTQIESRSKGLLNAKDDADCRIEMKRTEQNKRMSFFLRNVCPLTRCDVGQVVLIDRLPDVALLSIFDFYVEEDLDTYQPTKKRIEVWQTLVHVCRRWRCIVFGFPRGLNLRLFYAEKTPVEMLKVWPPLPIVIHGNFFFSTVTSGLDNIIAALKHDYRICDLSLHHPSSPQLEKVVDAMRQTFSALSILELRLPEQSALVVLPDSFLGGSAPRLQTLVLKGILFQALPKLLLSTTRLSTLSLLDIPHSGYISPGVMVTYLSALTNLERLCLGFPSPSTCPNHANQPSPPSTRTVLPALTSFGFTGFTKYLEDLVARIDAPILDSFSLSFSDELAFDIPQVVQFIGRTPKLKVPIEAKLIFDFHGVEFTLPLPSPIVDKEDERLDDEELILGTSINLRYPQISSLAQARGSSLFPLSTVKRLVIRENDDPSMDWDGDIDIEDVRWLLCPFTAVETLYLSEELEPHIEPALPDLDGERMTEILPALQDIDYAWR